MFKLVKSTLVLTFDKRVLLMYLLIKKNLYWKRLFRINKLYQGI